MGTRTRRWTRVATTTAIAGAVAPGILRWLRRTGSKRRSVDLRMTVVVERPIREVFEFCRDFENFPKIVDVPLEVSDFLDGRSHWTLKAPGGRRLEWDATVTKYVPNSVIAWQSVPGSPVHAGGLMRFAPLSEADTRVDISLTYRPMQTGLGDALRTLVREPSDRRLRAKVARASRELGKP